MVIVLTVFHHLKNSIINFPLNMFDIVDSMEFILSEFIMC